MNRLFAAIAIMIAAIANAAPSHLPGGQFLTEKVVVDIARATFSATSSPEKPTLTQLDRRSLLVKEWLSSVGGNTWYSNYLKEFGSPPPEELAAATLIGLSNKRLGSYYLTTPSVSPDSMKRLSCNSPKLDVNTTVKAFCALANWNAASTFNDGKSLAEFQTWAGWFLKNQKDGRWEWSADLPGRNQKAPWISGLTQSLGISILLREYQLSNNENYLTAAGKALDWVRKPISEGGIAIRTAQGAWYEEYPDLKNPSHVMNGHMWTLFGIWDYYRVTGDTPTKKMFDEGVAMLKVDIHKYDVENWSVYAQTNRVDMVNGVYQQFIIEQLRVLYAITGDEIFDKYATKWANTLNNNALFISIAAKEFLKANPHFAPNIARGGQMPKPKNN